MEDLYETRCFGPCVDLLLKHSNTSADLLEDLIVQNNVTAARLQNAYATGDAQPLQEHIDQLHQLWNKISSLPYRRSLTPLTLTCASNLIYAQLVNEKGGKRDDEFAGLAIEALERVVFQYGKAPLYVSNQPMKKFEQLARFLQRTRELDLTDLLLVLYISSLLALCSNNSEIIYMTEELVQDVRMKDGDLDERRSPLFLLSPINLPLIVHRPHCRRSITDFCKTVLGLYFCCCSSWDKALTVLDIRQGPLEQLSNLMACYAKFGAGRGADISWTGWGNDDELLSFAKHLLQATWLAADRKPSMALELYRMAIAGGPGATRAASIAVVGAAMQFQVRGEWNLAVEAWTTAAEMLANSPSLACRLHSEPVGFFLHRLGLLRPPDPAAVRYRLARTLLENQVYDAAAAAYERLADDAVDAVDVEAGRRRCAVPSPAAPPAAVVVHERVAALLAAKRTDRAVQVVRSTSSQDFVLLYLHGQAVAAAKQPARAVPLLNRAIQEVNSVGGPPVDVARVLESRLRWHLAVLFDSMANVKDALHQLCVAVQRHPTDADLTAFYRQYVAKSGVKIQPQLGVQTSQDEAVMHLVDGYLESNDDWSLRHLLTPPVGAVKST